MTRKYIIAFLSLFSFFLFLPGKVFAFENEEINEKIAQCDFNTVFDTYGFNEIKPVVSVKPGAIWPDETVNENSSIANYPFDYFDVNKLGELGFNYFVRYRYGNLGQNQYSFFRISKGAKVYYMGDSATRYTMYIAAIGQDVVIDEISFKCPYFTDTGNKISSPCEYSSSFNYVLKSGSGVVFIDNMSVYATPSNIISNFNIYTGYGSDNIATARNEMFDTCTNPEPTPTPTPTPNPLDETNKQLDDLNKNITDDTPPDLSGLDTVGWLPQGPVDSIINLPLSFFNSLNNSLGKSCQPLHLDAPFIDKEVNLPCVNSIYAQIPNFSDVFNWIGRITSAIILCHYLMALYKWVDDTLSFRENTWSDWGGV